MLRIIPKLVKDRPLAQLLSAHALGAGGLEFKSAVVLDEGGSVQQL